MSRHTDILNGSIVFPNQILEILGFNTMPYVIDDFWNSLVNKFFQEDTLDTITWYNYFDNEQLFNTLLYHLINAGWINVSTEANYSYIELREDKILKWITKEKLDNLRYKYKFHKYLYRYEPALHNDVVKVHNTYKYTGLIREGFRKAGNLVFTYDNQYLEKYLPHITWNILKGIYKTSSTKDISYEELGKDLLQFHSYVSNEYSLNSSLIDSRGRAIYRCTSKIFNPISHKDARAMIQLKPRPLSQEGLQAVYLFISELLGYKPNTIEEKIELGKQAASNHTYPEIIVNSNNHITNTHELIWLERIYKNLEDTANWNVAIEIDATASIIQMFGTLINCHSFLYGTNLAYDGQLHDIWTQPNLTRNQVKKFLTPQFYGSSASAESCWDKNDIPYTDHDIHVATELLFDSQFTHALEFRDFIIENVNPQPTMQVHILNEKFKVYCNRFKWNQTERKDYYVYSNDYNVGKIRKITREVECIPDLKRFKRYFITCLCHNLDSQVANNIALNLDYVLPNHDAFIIHPNDAVKCRSLYVKNMSTIYRNRHIILSNYFKSIGITKQFADIDKEELPFSPTALK